MRVFFALSAAAALFLAQAQAEERTLSDNFSLFRWNGNGVFASDTYTLKLDKPAHIQVTDFKNRGDMFEIYDNDQLIGETSQVEEAKDDSIFASSPEEALVMDQYSKGIFELAAGDHKITIKARGPYEAGTAAIRFVTDNMSRNIFKKMDHDDDKEDGWNKPDEGEWGNKSEEGGWGQSSSQEFDNSHTITITKTSWIVERPTAIPISTSSAHSYGYKYNDKKNKKKGGYKSGDKE